MMKFTEPEFEVVKIITEPVTDIVGGLVSTTEPAELE